MTWLISGILTWSTQRLSPLAVAKPNGNNESEILAWSSTPDSWELVCLVVFPMAGSMIAVFASGPVDRPIAIVTCRISKLTGSFSCLDDLDLSTPIAFHGLRSA